MATRARMSHANPYLYQDMKGHPVIIITISNIHSNTSKYNKKNVWGGFSQLSLICHCRTESKRNNKETLIWKRKPFYYQHYQTMTISNYKTWCSLTETHAQKDTSTTDTARRTVPPLSLPSSYIHHWFTTNNRIGRCPQMWGVECNAQYQSLLAGDSITSPFLLSFKDTEPDVRFIYGRLNKPVPFLHASISLTRIEYFFVWRKSISDQQSLWRVCCSPMDWLNSPCDVATQKTRTSMEGCNIVQQMTILGAGR